MIKSDIIAVDTETTGLNPWTGCRPFAISMASPDGQTAWYEFPVQIHTRNIMYTGIWNKYYDEVKAILEDDKITKVFFNAPFDIRMLEFADIHVKGRIEELSLAVRILGVDRPYWSLKPLCNHYFEIDTTDEIRLRKNTQTLRARAKLLDFKLGECLEEDYWLNQYASQIMLNGLHELKTYQNASPTKQNSLNNEAKEIAKAMRGDVETYGTLDAIRTITGWLFFSDMLDEKKMRWLYDEELTLLMGTSYPMVSRGIQTLPDAIQRGAARARGQQVIARFRLNQAFWRGFNPNSPLDKRKYFIDWKGLAPLNLTKKGMEPSIDETFLEYYAKKEPGAKAIVQYTAAKKVKSTYFDWMLANHDSEWVLHPDLNQWGTLTGRFSGRFLTIPKRAKPGSIMLDVRKCLIPREGYYWLLADYAQIEARIFADEFEETTLIEAFRRGDDPYVALQNVLIKDTGIDVGRQVAKNIFLGKIYGLGLEHLIEMVMEESHLDVDHDGAGEVVETFDNTFPIVKDAMAKTTKRVERVGFVRNRYGQVIRVPYDYAYKGVNYIIQSTAQRVIKRAMIRLTEKLGRLRDKGVDSYLLLQIHDELMFECTKSIVPKTFVKVIKPIMENTGDMFPYVKLNVDFEICRTNWLEKEELLL